MAGLKISNVRIFSYLAKNMMWDNPSQALARARSLDLLEDPKYDSLPEFPVDGQSTHTQVAYTRARLEARKRIREAASSEPPKEFDLKEALRHLKNSTKARNLVKHLYDCNGDETEAANRFHQRESESVKPENSPSRNHINPRGARNDYKYLMED